MVDTTGLEIKDVAGLVSIAFGLGADKGDRFWWRGESEDYDTALIPSMLRATRAPKEEASILANFRQGAHSRRVNLPDRADRAAWLFLMQHCMRAAFGRISQCTSCPLPTRSLNRG